MLLAQRERMTAFGARQPFQLAILLPSKSENRPEIGARHEGVEGNQLRHLGAKASFADELTLSAALPNLVTHILHVHGKISGPAYDGPTHPAEVYLTMSDLATLKTIAVGDVWISWDGSAVTLSPIFGVGNASGSLTNISLDPTNINFDLSVTGLIGSGAYGLDEQLRLNENSTSTMDIDFSDTITNDIDLPPGVTFTSKGGFLSEKATPLPEPTTLTLFGAGIAGAAAMRRRKKKAAK